ncbi:MAG: saccharopine dehydrogenase C-terminal domain-containing protein [Ferruginibacter sp.]
MKNILLFGAGKSASVLIEYLLENAAENNWHITIADSDKVLIEQKTNNHPSSTAVAADITDDELRATLILESDLVISMMPPSLHILIAKDCVLYSKHLLTASYADEEIKALAAEVKTKGILFLCEMGLDPGIDHMSAMQLIHNIKEKGGKISSFKSHCGGLVAPENDDNPWHYKISWNPRNVVLAGKAGAQYKQHGKIITEKYEDLFDAERKIGPVDGLTAALSYYPNRNSIPYIDLYGLHDADTFIRTTLRYRDFILGWKNIISLKLTDEIPIYESDGLSLAAFFQQHMDKYGFTEKLVEDMKENEAFTSEVLKILADTLGPGSDGEALVVEADGNITTKEQAGFKEPSLHDLSMNAHDGNKILQQLYFLGMDDETEMINKGLISAADGLQFALEKKLVLAPADKDMIVMQHEIEYLVDGKCHKVISSLVVNGKDNIHTAMAKTVGLPLGIAAKLILNGTIKLSGLHLPLLPEIYTPLLQELDKYGIRFTDTISK